MLLDPFKKEFHLPARLAEMRDRERGQREVVREKDESLLRLGVDVPHAPQGLRIVNAALCRRQDDHVIREHARGEVDRPRRPPREPNSLFRARHEERRLLGEAGEPREVDIAAIHDVARTRFGQEGVEGGHIGALSGRNLHHGGDRTAQVDQRVQLDRRIAAAIVRPRKDRQTEFDDRGVEGVDRVRQVDGEGVVIEGARRADEAVREVAIDAPVPRFVGIRHGRPRDARANADVIQLGLHGAETRFDVAQALPIRQLCEGHA